MGEDKSTHNLEMRRQRGLRTANIDGEDKCTHILEMRRQMGVSGQQTQMGEDKCTHFLEMRQRGVSEDSKHRWGRTKAHTH